MANTKISEYSSTPGNNTDIDGINIAEGCAPSGINNAIRELMSQLKDFQAGTVGDSFNGPHNGTVGATTPASGAFTTLSSTGNTTLGNDSGDVITINGTTTFGSGATVSSPLALSAGTASAPALTTTGDTNTGIFFPAADTIAFAEGGAEVARFDSSGNLGLGVTPSAWGSGNKAIQLGSGAALVSVGAFTILGQNYYSDGSNLRYINTGASSYFQQSAGAFNWYNAPSGTAGNAISFTQAMTLDASGNLDLGTTGGSDRYQNIIATSARLSFNAGTGFSGSAATSIYNQSAIPMVFGTNNTERARIDSSGNLLVGRTTVPVQNTAGAAIQSTGLIITESSQTQGGLWVNRITSDGTAINFTRQNVAVGSISVTGSATAYNTSSDYRLKNTIAPMTGALAKVAALKPCTYKWNADGSDGEGFIAHELAEVVPQCVTGEKDAVDAEGNPQYQGIDTSFLVATLAAAIQEQQALIQTLTARVAALESN
jgi:hypothetical protein